MRITEFSCKGFRNLEEVSLVPSEGINILYGENAQGKTNLLEALWLFSGLKSFRGAKDSEMVAFRNQTATLRLNYRTQKRDNTVKLTIQNRRSAVLNGVKLPSASALMGKYSAVVFAPAFLSVIKDGPGERRRFTDAAICQLKPAYGQALQQYMRVLKQRNVLLKDIKLNAGLYDMLDILDEQLASAGEFIVRERKAYLDTLSPFVKEIYGSLSSGREEIGMEYIGAGENLREVLNQNRKTDIMAQMTTKGPHRDDMDIRVNGVPARVYGSQGQQRSCSLALKLGEASVIKEQTGEQPVALLDDVMSELDTLRQDYILNHIRDWQVFITCCEPSSVLRMMSGNTVNVKNGRLY